jgi:V-type H+-transporting ATPase subunit E
MNSSKQIHQMVNFIMQEAHEKVNEIRLRTDHDFNLEKQKLIRDGRIRIHEDFERKEKDAEIQARVQRSNAVGQAKVRKLNVRADLMASLQKNAMERLQTFVESNPEAYGQLLSALLLQSLIKMEELEVGIKCRQEDVATIQSIIPSVLEKYQTQKRTLYQEERKNRGEEERTLSESQWLDILPNPTIIVNEDPRFMLSTEQHIGGIMVMADRGLIMCDNTLKTRLELAMEQGMPYMRSVLF